MKPKLAAVVLILIFLLAFGGQSVAFAQEGPLADPDPTPALFEVTGLVAKSTNYNTVTLSWVPVEGATDYVVYRSMSRLSGFKQIGVTKAPAFRSTKLTTGKRYYFQVQPRNATLTGNLSTIAVMRPSLQKTTSVKAASPSPGVAKVVWKKVPGATKYAVYRSRSQSGGFRKCAVVKKNAYIDNSAYQGNTFYYKIVPYRGSVKGPISNYGKAKSKVEPRIQAFLNAAKAEMGKPYVLGGKGPSVFDCSGLIYYALNQSGYSINYKTSHGWVGSGYTTITDFKQLQAGDILARPGHVAIYVGNNKTIEAVHAGVSQREYWSFDGIFTCAKRIF